jgi:uncharacterized membrane protein YebE (DUF533 family)
MTLPPELLRCLTDAGAAPIRAAARALYDLEGHLGETWAVTDGARLFLLSRRIGEEFKFTPTALKDIDDLGVRDDSAFAYLQIQSAGKTRELKFSAWDRRDLDALCLCWTEATGQIAREGTRHLQLEPIGTAHPPVSALTPLTAFCAAIHAMMRADGHPDASELFVIQTALHDPGVIERGRQWLEHHGEEALLKGLFGLLNDEQKLCLLANAAAVGMADGMWRTREQGWLDRLQKVLAVPEAEFQPVFDVLLIQHGLNVFESDTAAHGGPTAPLTLLAASLRAMAEVDGGIGPEEHALIWQLVEDAEIGTEAESLLRRDGLETVMRHAALALSLPQKNCLLTNLLKVAMVDGVLRSKEQALLEHFRRELGVAEGPWQAMHHALMVKNNLTVFAV